MKKLFAFIVIVSMLITTSSIVLAETTANSDVVFSASASADFDTSNGLDTYNADGTIYVTVSLGEVSIPETVTGVSAFVFKIVYDTDMVVPAVSDKIDADGEAFDFTAFIDDAPDGWECFGRIDYDNGTFELSPWDATSKNAITVADALTVTVPFSVKPDAKVDDIAFSFAGCEIYDEDPLVFESLEISGFSVEYALQPDVLTKLPEKSVSLDIAGYQSSTKNVIYYAENDITVGDYVASYTNNADAQEGMNDFAIIIVNAKNGMVTYSNVIVDGNKSDKSDVVIPADHYIIGVHSDNTDDYIYFCEFAKVDTEVNIYNVNPETTGKFDTGVALENAGFAFSNPKPVLKEGALAIYDFEEAVITVYDTKLDVKAFKSMFENDVTVLDENGNELTSGYVANGMTIDYADGVTIIMLGDVDSDGEIDVQDYVLIKRYCLKTFNFEPLELMAAQVAGNYDVGVVDYIYVKRICLKTLKLSVLM